MIDIYMNAVLSAVGAIVVSMVIVGITCLIKRKINNARYKLNTTIRYYIYITCFVLLESCFFSNIVWYCFRIINSYYYETCVKSIVIRESRNVHSEIKEDKHMMKMCLIVFWITDRFFLSFYHKNLSTF